MTAGERLARKLIKQAISERIAEIHDAWAATGPEDRAKREELHVELRATIGLEELLYARLGPDTGG